MQHALAVSVLVLPASAASLNNSAIQTAITLGAMDTSQTGSLDAAVTRGAFAKMLVSFSAYRESASQQGNLGTLYKDVPGQLSVGTLCAHCGAAGLDERLY